MGIVANIEYWKDKGDAKDVFRVDTRYICNQVKLTRLRDGLVLSCQRKFYDAYEPIPLPSVGEVWQSNDFWQDGKEVRIISSVSKDADYPIIANFENGTLAGMYTFDFFMLNYHKVKDTPKEETRVNERNEDVPTGAGHQRGDTGGSVPKEDGETTNLAVDKFFNPTFKDTLKEEAARLREDLSEADKEIESLRTNRDEIATKLKDFDDMLGFIAKFTSRYPETE